MENERTVCKLGPNGHPALSWKWQLPINDLTSELDPATVTSAQLKVACAEIGVRLHQLVDLGGPSYEWAILRVG